MSAPMALRRKHTGLDNITLMPDLALPFKAEWEAVQRELPVGEALLVVTASETPLKQLARAPVPQLRAHGRHVTAVAASHAAGGDR